MKLRCLVGIHRWGCERYGVGPAWFWRTADCRHCSAQKFNVTGRYSDFSL